eukprot:6253537-Pyramimonas_sp.AAC.1
MRGRERGSGSQRAGGLRRKPDEKEREPRARPGSVSTRELRHQPASKARPSSIQKPPNLASRTTSPKERGLRCP